MWAGKHVWKGWGKLGAIAFCMTLGAASAEAQSTASQSATWDQLNATFDLGGLEDHRPSDKDPDGSGPGIEAFVGEPDAGSESGDPATAGGFTNCPIATEIPGDVVTYNPALQNTTGIISVFCLPFESCDGASGSSRAVIYRYVPDRSGLIDVNTFGSNYNTVLSVFDGCATSCGIGCCNQPNQLYCNDNAPLSQQSQLFIEVEAGETYVFKAAALGGSATGGLLDFNLRWIPSNQICEGATEIVGTTFADVDVPTVHATQGLCEANESCELNNVGVSNTVFYRFTAPCDGFLNANTNGSTYDTVLSVWDGCGEFQGVDFPCLLPNELECDDDAGVGLASQVVDVPVSAGETYYLKVSDYNTTVGGGFLDFHFQFVGADPPVAEITMPDALACVCDELTIEGTAAANGSLSTYMVEIRPINGGEWSLIVADDVEVSDGVLGMLDTTGLSGGYYHLRLTVENFCGLTSTDVQTIYIDKGFDTIDLRSPAEESVVGGAICIDGTVWDRCFKVYRVDYAAEGSENYEPVDPNMDEYESTVTNDPLADWNSTDLEDGAYILRILATDTCEHPAEESITIEIDNTAPFAQIMAPEGCSCHDGVLEISGTVYDEHLASWVLQYTGGGADEWTTIGSGSSPVFQNTLGTLNLEALDPCPVALRLIVVDATIVDCVPGKRFTEHVVTIDVGACGGYDFDTDDDGDVDLIDYGAFMDEYTGP